MFTAAAAGTERIFEILDYEPEVDDASIETVPTELRGRIEFRDLVYSHPGSLRPTIAGATLNVEPGETIAFMGRVGSGKSTLLNAIVRLVDTPGGMIFLDGHDIHDFATTLRQTLPLLNIFCCAELHAISRNFIIYGSNIR